MKKNLGSADRVIRLILALVIVALYYTGVISGLLGIILIVLAVIFFATSLVSICPIYMLLGLNTKKKS